VKLKTPKKPSAKRGAGALDEVKLSIWIPDNVRVLRGVIVNPFNLKQVERKDYHEAAGLWKFNEYVARVWQAFVSRLPNLSIRRPVSKPEEKSLLKAGSEFSILACLSGSAVVRAVEYFDVPNLLAEKADNVCQADIAGLPSGVRALIAVVRIGDMQVVSKPVAVVVHPAEEGSPSEGETATECVPLSGKISIVLDGAVFQDRILDGEPYQGPPVPVYLETAYEDGHWEKVLGNAPSFNRGHHRGRVLESDVADDRIRMIVEMSINSDPWVPGGRAEYEVELERSGPQRFQGRFSGTFRGRQMSAKATVEVAKLPQPPEGFFPFKPEEHPRILFRKSDVPLIKEKAKTPIGRVVMKKIGEEKENAIALGIMHQLTGDRKYAEATVPVVRAKMKERGWGAFATGHIWGERLAYVALAYDLCKEAWDEEFIREVQHYLDWITGRLIFRPRSVSRKVNYSPNSNYHAWLRGGAGIGALALVGDKGPEPDPPRDPGTEPIRLRPLSDFKPGKGVPVSRFTNDETPKWLVAGPFLDAADAGADLFAHVGGSANARPELGTKLSYQGKTATFQPLDAEHLWAHPSFTHGMAIDLTGAAGRALHTTSYYYAVVENGKGRLVEFLSGASGGNRLDIWISGQRFYDREYVHLPKGLHPILIRARIGETSSWGRIWMEPRFVEVSLEEAEADLAKRQVSYKLALAEWTEDHRAWEEMDGASPRWLYLAELAKYHMDQYFRYCFGDGGWQTEGESYTLYSCVLPLEYAQAYQRMYGMPVTGRPDASHFAPRYVMQTIFGGERLVSQSFSLPGGTMHAGHYARAFPLVLDKWKPGILWAWNKTMGLTPEGRGDPEMQDPMTAIYTLLNYPTDMKAKNPGKCMPRTWAATTKGGYIFRNRWQDTNDIVTQVFLKSEGEGGWSHPDAGSIRLYGLGHAWGIEGVNNSKAGGRWFENVVMLPEDDVNVGTRALATHYEGKDDGSGVISMDMNQVYCGRKTIRDSKGNERKAKLVDNGFRYLRENLLNLGIRGMRSVAVDYSGKCGAPALLAVVDKISGGGKKIWQWQLPKLDDKSDSVEISGSTFTIRQGDASLKATFVTPAGVKLEIAKGERTIHLKYGKYDGVNLNAVHAAGGDNFFVIMTLQQDEAPQVGVEGTGLSTRATVGTQTISFDGEKIVFAK